MPRTLIAATLGALLLMAPHAHARPARHPAPAARLAAPPKPPQARPAHRPLASPALGRRDTIRRNWAMLPVAGAMG